MMRASPTRRVSQPALAAIPSGESPAGTGESPVPPGLTNTGAEEPNRSNSLRIVACPVLARLRPGEVVWRDWLCAENEKVFIRVASKRVKGLSPVDDLTTQALRVAVRRGVGDKDLAGERGDKVVALPGGLFIRAIDVLGKRRQQKQPAILQWLTKLSGYSL